ncbi:hypothetical protein [Caproicibacterium amylolyticum]|uniref:Uncharacterized protein n=1 Tax=Caproicibacterium amylolyticum TaxID=2766537 RepID=A0A7G9WGQ3_9FIRM|nr:hypothetical protein [Caproicibacterium amylolyticum]QNO17865.1 hypothetical protein H6X83_13270 [Caproicibacterium amylolyticum]
MDSFISMCSKLVNRLIMKSRNFCNISCVPDGLMDILKIYSATGVIEDDSKYSSKLSYDYDYFAFAKSTKTLLAIHQLLLCKDYNFSEDCFALIRSIFENHILSRYVRENIDDNEKQKEVVDNFVLAPLGVSFDYYESHGRSGIFTKNNEKVGDIKNPRSIIMGKEKDYYDQLYPFLCQYTHCSYGAISCYFSPSGFTYTGHKFLLLTYLLTIFVFTKMYEGVITVNGEDLVDNKTMKSYYDLAYDSLELQIKVMDILIEYYRDKPQEQIEYIIEKYIGEGKIDNSNFKISRMLTKMKDSLFDNEIGSLDKSTFTNGCFVRKYQEW